LQVRESPIHSRGCFATLPIKKGTRVLEYTGRRISVAEANRRYYTQPSTYLFGLSDGRTVIDGIGMASIMNHSCEPNCEAEEVNGRVFLVALGNIANGEELTISGAVGNGRPLPAGERSKFSLRSVNF
jgi:SET domain-containing protein